jgi:hypothetical protein
MVNCDLTIVIAADVEVPVIIKGSKAVFGSVLPQFRKTLSTTSTRLSLRRHDWLMPPARHKKFGTVAQISPEFGRKQVFSEDSIVSVLLISRDAMLNDHCIDDTRGA